MHALTKAFIAGAIGSVIAAWAEPKLISMFPSIAADAASMQRKLLDAAVAGAAAALVWHLLGEAK